MLLTNLDNASSKRQGAKGVIKETSTHWDQWRNTGKFLNHILNPTQKRVWRIGHLIKYIHLAKGKRRHN